MTETGAGAEPPNPFSREGSQAADGTGAHPAAAPAAQPFEPYPAAAVNPNGTAPGPPPPVFDPGFDPEPTPPYGSDGAAPPYGLVITASSYPSPSPSAYGSNPYEYTPYQPAYGGSVPYGVVVQVSHPKSTTALVFGILGIVFGLMCGIGGLLGIPGIVQGRRARAEIDAEPGRYTGRSQAVAGIVTGVIGVVIAALVLAVAVVAIILYATTPGGA